MVQANSLCFYIHIKTHLLCYILFCSCATYILLKNKFSKKLVGGFFFVLVDNICKLSMNCILNCQYRDG